MTTERYESNIVSDLCVEDVTCGTLASSSFGKGMCQIFVDLVKRNINQETLVPAAYEMRG